MAGPCPVCGDSLLEEGRNGDRYFYDCPRCGQYALSGRVSAFINHQLGLEKTSKARLSHALYKMTSREQWAMLDSEHLNSILQNSTVPSPQEQLENLILWMGTHQSSPGASASYSNQVISAMGALDEPGAGFLIAHAEEKGWLTVAMTTYSSGEQEYGPLKLTFNGWEYFYALQRGQSESRIAVMAMNYGDLALDAIVRDHFRPAVAATGFDLKRIDEGQPAGLIDDRMRVEIRQSRFLISDLTHDNNGAYWEAGYAEGLGKPVIYTCRKDVHEKEGTHFDTNHHLTVVWDPENLGEALEKLKATIRATLPEEAKLNDE